MFSYIALHELLVILNVMNLLLFFSLIYSASDLILESIVNPKLIKTKLEHESIATDLISHRIIYIFLSNISVLAINI